MEVRFRTNQLQKCYERHQLAVRKYGEEVARRYVLRVNIIKQVNDIDELMGLPVLRCHPLKGQRAGQYSIKLTGFYRLIFTLEDDPLAIARIEEVSKHYGD